MANVDSRSSQFVCRRTPLEALSTEAQKRLRDLMELLDPLGKLAARARSTGRRRETGGCRPKTADRRAKIGGRRRKAGGCKDAAKTNGQPLRRDIRLPKPGDVLSRYYKGKEITVRVHESGFEFEGNRFRSLSAIAKAVTGAHWNGLLFFGIVHQASGRRRETGGRS